MSLVSREELKRTFCVTKYYGENDLSHRWPQSTTCLVKCNVSDRYSPWKCITGTDEDSDDWERFNNTLGETKVHAETHMKNYLYNTIVKNYVGIKFVDICIYINYSPCYKCAEVIIDMMDRFKEMEIEVDIKIFFANFYKCHGNTTKNESNRTGLFKMLQKGVRLNVFSCDVWNDLLHKVLKLSRSRTFHHVIQDLNTISKRKKRDIIDMICLNCLIEKSKLPYLCKETDEEKERLRKVFEKNDKQFYLGNHLLADENVTDYETYVRKKGDEYIEYMTKYKEDFERRQALEERKRQLEQQQNEFVKCSEQIRDLKEKITQLEQEHATTYAEIGQMTQRLQCLRLQQIQY